MNEKLRLGDILISCGYITDEQLSTVLALQKQSGNKRMGELLLEQGFISEEELLIALSQRVHLSVIGIRELHIDLETVALIPKSISIKYNILAANIRDHRVLLVLNDPLDFYAIEDVKSFIPHHCDIVLCKKEDIRRTIEKAYSELDARSAASIANSSISTTPDPHVADLSVDSAGTPIVNLVNSIILKAHAEGASDIHFEPFEHFVNVRLRIDGQLLSYMQLEANLALQIATRIKIISDMDIAERRIPQDGNFKIQISSQNVGVRVSTLPSAFGEKIVLRFLSQAIPMDNADQYGMNLENYKKIRRMLHHPHGIIYITGPTGSGKTTTLYMMVEDMVKQPINISTIEDPIERNLPGIVQVQVNPPAGLTFASGLRSMLRQDPDVLLVGETRDTETAQIAVSASITGHLVLSTLHTNDAISSVVRLSDMGIEDYLIANSLTGLVAQRLVKKICPFCKTSYTPDAREARLFPDMPQLHRGTGCGACNNSGYKGRIAVHEVLEVDSHIRHLISTKAPTEEIYAYVRQENKMTFLADNIMDLVRSGVTSADEYLRQTHFSL